MKELLEMIARSLVDRPDEVTVEEFDEDGALVFEMSVDPDDMGKVIGRQGRIANALRTLLDIAGARQGCRFILDIVD